jgi:hypothetical protein
MEKRNKRLHLTVIAVFILVGASYAQVPDTLWTKTYGGAGHDYGRDVHPTSDSGFIIVGTTYSFGAGSGDVYLIKIDANGDTVWTRTYGGADYEESSDVHPTSDGGYIIVGTQAFFPAGSSGVYLIKTETNGDTIWTKTYGVANCVAGYDVHPTLDNGYIITGTTPDSFGAGGNDVYLIKADANGDTIWTRTYGGVHDEFGYSVHPTSDSGYIIVGPTNSYGAGGSDVYLIKTDVNGDTIWTRTYGGSYWDEGSSVRQTSDSGYIIVGNTDSYGAGSNDIYLIKTDANGDTIWTRTYGGANAEYGSDVHPTLDSGYVIVGQTYSFGAGDVYSIKTDANGNTLWTRTYGGSGNDSGRSIQQCDITWIATDNIGVDSIDIFYSTDAGGSWDIIATGEPNDSLYEWIVPNTPSDSCLVKILVYDPSLNIGEDQSDSLFIISPEGINEDISSVRSVLLQCTPNPFSTLTNISFSIGQRAKNIELKIYDVSGQLVKTISVLSAYVIMPTMTSWGGRNNTDEEVPGGIYFLRLEAGNYAATKKLILLK